MKLIPVGDGRYALVDACDYERLSNRSWRLHRGKNGMFYAVRFDRELGLIGMHREVLGYSKHRIDHRNRDGLDNRRENLRWATNSENMMNQGKRAGLTSRFKGVSKRPGEKWKATIWVNGERRDLGRFSCERRAAEAYDKAALELFGEFARTNKMMGKFDRIRVLPPSEVVARLAARGPDDNNRPEAS